MGFVGWRSIWLRRCRARAVKPLQIERLLITDSPSWRSKLEKRNFASLLGVLDDYLSSASADAENRLVEELPRAIPCRRAGLALPAVEDKTARAALAGRDVGEVTFPPDRRLLVAVAGERLLWLEDAPAREWSPAERALARHVAVILASGSRPRDPAMLAERMRIAGRVASRIAHDFDNILTGVIGFAELSLPAAPLGATKQYLTELLRVGHSGAELTRKLHLFGREIPAQKLPTKLQAAWRIIEDPLRAAVPAGTDLEVAFPDDLPEIVIVAETLQLALEPVVSNAAEAAPKLPISVSARCDDLTAEDTIEIFGCPPPGRYVVITVADRGPGIAPEVRRRLFIEPCFSTKPRHRGLGLSIAFRVLLAHGGGLGLDSNDDGGAAVRLYLPTASR